MKWLLLLLRLIRNWGRLEKEGFEAIHTALPVIQAARRSFLAGETSKWLIDRDLSAALKELSEAVAVAEEIIYGCAN